MADNHRYTQRQVKKDPSKEFRMGEGRISAFLSLALGVLSILAVLAYLYPSYLTTTELRKAYDAEQLQQVLKYGMWFSLLFGVLGLVLNFVLYWEHPAYHEVNLLWPIHAVHHSVENLDWLAGSREN